jgi:hypothetical protein
MERRRSRADLTGLRQGYGGPPTFDRRRKLPYTSLAGPRVGGHGWLGL